MIEDTIYEYNRNLGLRRNEIWILATEGNGIIIRKNGYGAEIEIKDIPRNIVPKE